MNTNTPLVTVYIPTYNRVELLKRSVESVRKQTYENLEIIIVDDCSTDDTQQYLADIAKEEPRVRYFLKEKNSGACASRNIAINNANGEYITGLDDDDIFLPNRISSFIKQIHKYDMDKVILFSGYKCGLSTEIKIRNKIRLFLSKKIVHQQDLILSNYIGNQIFVKTHLLKENEGFDENFKMWQDLECWYRLLSTRMAICVQEITYCVDTEHGYERITNVDKLYSTYDLFCKKHNIKYKQKEYLKLHFLGYGIYPPNFLKLSLYRLIKTLDIRDLITIIQYVKFIKK